MENIETNRLGVSLADWDERARDLDAPEEFFSWEKREDYWWRGMSPRWTVKHFRNVLIVRNVTKKAEDFRKKTGFKTGNNARNHKK